METFPIILRNDDKRFGDYRTKLLIFEIYDRMRKAIDTVRLISRTASSYLPPTPVSP